MQLTIGQEYYMEALHKAGTGVDHLSVGVTLPSGRNEWPIPKKYIRFRPHKDLLSTRLNVPCNYEYEHPATSTSGNTATKSTLTSSERVVGDIEALMGDDEDLNIQPVEHKNLNNGVQNKLFNFNENEGQGEKNFEQKDTSSFQEEQNLNSYNNGVESFGGSQAQERQYSVEPLHEDRQPQLRQKVEYYVTRKLPDQVNEKAVAKVKITHLELPFGRADGKIADDALTILGRMDKKQRSKIKIVRSKTGGFTLSGLPSALSEKEVSQVAKGLASVMEEKESKGKKEKAKNLKNEKNKGFADLEKEDSQKQHGADETPDVNKNEKEKQSSDDSPKEDGKNNEKEEKSEEYQTSPELETAIEKLRESGKEEHPGETEKEEHPGEAGKEEHPVETGKQDHPTDGGVQEPEPNGGHGEYFNPALIAIKEKEEQVKMQAAGGVPLPPITEHINPLPEGPPPDAEPIDTTSPVSSLGDQVEDLEKMPDPVPPPRPHAFNPAVIALAQKEKQDAGLAPAPPATDALGHHHHDNKGFNPALEAGLEQLKEEKDAQIEQGDYHGHNVNPALLAEELRMKDEAEGIKTHTKLTPELQKEAAAEIAEANKDLDSPPVSSPQPEPGEEDPFHPTEESLAGHQHGQAGQNIGEKGSSSTAGQMQELPQKIPLSNSISIPEVAQSVSWHGASYHPWNKAAEAGLIQAHQPGGGSHYGVGLPDHGHGSLIGPLTQKEPLIESVSVLGNALNIRPDHTGPSQTERVGNLATTSQQSPSGSLDTSTQQPASAAPQPVQSHHQQGNVYLGGDSIGQPVSDTIPGSIVGIGNEKPVIQPVGDSHLPTDVSTDQLPLSKEDKSLEISRLNDNDILDVDLEGLSTMQQQSLDQTSHLRDKIAKPKNNRSKLRRKRNKITYPKR
uniref:Uncharacterized protein n=3 Tax=Clytia hemisphaerica TaxID=252671 RepID=A0A7M5X4S0_9CNID